MRFSVKYTVVTIFLTLLTLQTSMAQTTKEANPADVSSVDAIMKAVYDVISGDAGQKRDWDRFRTLFHKDARMIPTGTNPKTKVTGATSFTPEDYIRRVEPVFAKDGFHEREKARHTESFGNIVHAFSTYEAFHSLSEKTPFLRGINSIQLLSDGKRWWIVTIFWQAESPSTPLPKKYLKSKN
ncbi:MAG: hypothetical protein M3449_09080 [Acidobacteriota bacterium]|nr:hypothetical protein [Acidobacteriota bacterium]MDQ3491197.1 hypothetical protein [Acidobacteriota bacterium]